MGWDGMGQGRAEPRGARRAGPGDAPPSLPTGQSGSTWPAIFRRNVGQHGASEAIAFPLSSCTEQSTWGRASAALGLWLLGGLRG